MGVNEIMEHEMLRSPNEQKDATSDRHSVENVMRQTRRTVLLIFCGLSLVRQVGGNGTSPGPADLSSGQDDSSCGT
jgi:hypothetical protein